MKDEGLSRLAKLYDTVTTVTLLKKLDQLSLRYLAPVQPARDAATPLTVVLDNVDKYLRARQTTHTRGNTMTHMVQALAVVERIQRQPGSPAVQLTALQPSLFLPTQSDTEKVTRLFAAAVKDIWSAYIPALSRTFAPTTSATHLKAAETGKRVVFVSESDSMHERYKS